MKTYGADVTPSPSDTTEVGRKILAEHPGTTGSLGCAISEAVEAATTREGYRYVLGSVLSQVLLHQSVIGLETKKAMDKYGIKPDVIIGCAGGCSNLGGLISPFMGEQLRGEANYHFIAVEPASCLSLIHILVINLIIHYDESFSEKSSDFCSADVKSVRKPVSYTHLDVYKRQVLKYRRRFLRNKVSSRPSSL